MSDLISRKAAIEAIKASPPGNWASVRYAREIEKVPAVDAAIVAPCETCLYWVPNNAEEGDCSGQCTNGNSICNGRTTGMNWFCADGEREP